MKKGYFWICPILWDPKTMELRPRYIILFPLLEIMLFLHHSMLMIASFFNINIEYCYPIKITNHERKNRADIK